MASGAAHTAHAGADAAGLRFGGEGVAAAGQRGGGEEHKVRIAQGRTAVQGIAEAVPDGKGSAPGDGGAAAALPAGGNGSLYEKDAYGAYTICNIYYDTGDWRLIRKSLEKTVYKEKLRIRSYGVPTGGRQGVCGTEEEVRRRGVQAPRRHDRRMAVFQKRVG